VNTPQILMLSGLLDRCMRDALTMNQHVTNSLRSYGMAGRILLGLPGEFLIVLTFANQRKREYTLA
jgi:hypothetical protein